MQTGTVLYLTDSPNVPDDLDDRRLISEAGLEQGWTVLSAAEEGWMPMDAAIHSLIVKGAHRVEAVTCRVESDGRVNRFGSPLRIFG